MLFYFLPSGDHLFVGKIPELRLFNQLFASVMIFSLTARVIIIKLCFSASINYNALAVPWLQALIPNAFGRQSPFFLNLLFFLVPSQDI
jgi:hypothetical protein